MSLTDVHHRRTVRSGATLYRAVASVRPLNSTRHIVETVGGVGGASEALKTVLWGRGGDAKGGGGAKELQAGGARLGARSNDAPSKEVKEAAGAKAAKHEAFLVPIFDDEFVDVEWLAGILGGTGGQNKGGAGGAAPKDRKGRGLDGGGGRT